LLFHPDWLVPQWPAPSQIKSVFTTRYGGVSKPPFDSFNLGRPSGDDRSSVDANRARLQAAIGLAPVFMSQVHGVATVELPMAPNAVGAGVVVADACTSATPGVVCTVRVADCLPVLLSNKRGTVVAAAHAGWRGLANGVLEANFRAFEELVLRQSGPPLNGRVASETLAWLGPCIGPTAFEVGSEVRDAFLSHGRAAERCFLPRPNGKWLADLPALARQRLTALGITLLYGNDGSAPWCTVNNPLLFFSHRRDNVTLGGSGRMAACIWIA
jgi:YfiH family protein